MTRDIGPIIHDRWGKMNLFLNFSSLALIVKDWRFVEDIFTKDQSLTDLMTKVTTVPVSVNDPAT